MKASVYLRLVRTINFIYIEMLTIILHVPVSSDYKIVNKALLDCSKYAQWFNCFYLSVT